jgi:hypothetical protein
MADAALSRVGLRCRRFSTRAPVDRSIWSSVTCILSFGRYSGILIRALFGRAAHARRS